MSSPAYNFYPLVRPCRCVNACPHIGGASIKALANDASAYHRVCREFDQRYARLSSQFDQILDRANKLEDEVARLKAELRHERRRRFRRSADTPKPDAQPLQEEVAKRPPGGVPGHRGVCRPIPNDAECSINVSAPTSCPHCNARAAAYPSRCPDHHLQEDLYNGRCRVTCYIHFWSRCTGCRRWLKGVGPDELPGFQLGPQIRALVIYLRQQIGVSVDHVVDLLKECHGFEISAATIINIERHTARLAEPLAQDIQRRLPAVEVLHADETHWRIDGQRAYLWTHVTGDLAHFKVDPTRGGEVSRTILGPDFDGVLVTDCYAGYNQHVASGKQKCMAHLRRTAIDWASSLDDLSNQETNVLQTRSFLNRVRRFAEDAMRLDQQDPHRQKQKRKNKLRKELAGLIDEPLTRSHDKAYQLQQRLVVYQQDWLTFLKAEGIPATNNLAERALRPLVVIRKMTLGHKSWRGASSFGILQTLIQTARRQGRHVLRMLEAVISKPPSAAYRYLYGQPESG